MTGRGAGAHYFRQAVEQVGSLKAAWTMMQIETKGAMQFLGEEEEEVLGPLAAPAESAGEGSTTGATRKKLVEARCFA